MKIDYDPESEQFSASVEDTGLGIREKEQGKLFSMFGKLKSTSKINANGIGLGLFTCKRICEILDGNIRLAKSRLNEGTEFTFTVRT